MDKIDKILTSHSIILNNVIKNNRYINDNNVSQIRRKKYSLDRSKFTPNTEETQLADEIATKFNDLDNYACYLSVIKKIGVSETVRLFKSVLSDIQEKLTTRTPVRDPARYFMWKYKKRLY